MKIYEISYTLAEEVELPEDVELPDGIDENDIRKFTECTIHLGGNDIASVLEEAAYSIEAIHGDLEDEEFIPEYEIAGIKELPNVDVINWPGEFEPCQCPQCRAKRMASEDVMHFNCPNCNHSIDAAPDNWETLYCSECDQEILHDNIIELGDNKYKVIKISERKEK